MFITSINSFCYSSKIDQCFVIFYCKNFPEDYVYIEIHRGTP